MKNHKTLSIAALLLCSAPAFAYNTPEHSDFVTSAIGGICSSGTDSPLCAELSAYGDFLRFGSVMEDKAAKGFKTVFNGVEFRDEEPERYGPCKEKLLYGERHMYCNHYFFIENFLAGRPSAACGSNLLEATTPECGGKGAFQWESARERGMRLWEEKVIPNYLSADPGAKARAYYWLGRVAHLLADMSVPAHVTPHKINFMEFEHRAFEYEAGRGRVPGIAQEPTPTDLGGLFVELARRSLEIEASVRLDACRREPGLDGCAKGRATPTKPLESRLQVVNAVFVDAIMAAKPDALAKPEMVSERDLARAMLAEIKPLTVLYTVRLLELFGAQSGLKPAAMEMPDFLPGAADPADQPLLRLMPDFDGAAR